LRGIELSEKYYMEYGIPMIKNIFLNYEERIAVGLVGSGSECYGFDDSISADHDFGPSFCMWLTNVDYENIGAELENEYNKLPKTYMGYKRIVSSHGHNRVGVFKIGDFYKKYTRKTDANLSLSDWISIPEYFLAEVTNGKIFKDDLGEFSKIRSVLLNYYPEDVRIIKIFQRAAIMAQSGQYNYSRSMRRSEFVAARLCLDEFIKNTISMVYLLNKKYQPFYKWSYKGMESFSFLTNIREMISELVFLPIQDSAWSEENDYLWSYKLNSMDKAVGVIENICKSVIKELINQELTYHKDSFLENHTKNIMSRIKNDKIKAMFII